MTSAGGDERPEAGPPDPEAPVADDPGTAPETLAAIERLHAGILGVQDELPGLVDDAEASAAEG
ncbi:unannotated protein [freshwater metagenome]|uniref:Unannotated protein n=1 Tax=freshwater metagenome TaxID=449393 RepID=A0A6J7G8U5_9ZZZZ|nr:hypothetical protein [Actinomycetota bacterium]